MSRFENDEDFGVITERKKKVKKPKMYKVILLNDDYTTMEFVVEILVYVFQKSAEEATRIMLNVHRSGVGVCGIYPFEIAETKVAQVTSIAEQQHHPLLCTMEEA